MSGSKSLSKQHPGGCYVGFNAAIDRKAAEQMVLMISDARREGFREINLCLSSIGGILDHAYYAFTMIEALPINIVTWNVGNIQSAANIIFLCGDQRYATDGATFFFHQTSYDAPSTRITEPFLTQRLKAIQYDDNRSAEIIAAKTGKPVQDVRLWQNTELVMDRTAAQSHGLIHGVRQLVIPTNALFRQIIV